MSQPVVTDNDADAPPSKKKGKRLLVASVALIVLAGGTGGGLYAAGVIGGGTAPVAVPGPKLVPKAEQKRGGGGAEGGHGEEGGEGGGEGHGKPTPAGAGGDAYASNYYQFDKDFTSNLKDSDRFIQLGLALSTPYDDTVIEHIRTNEIAVRSAVLMTLGDTSEDDVADSAAKTRLAQRLASAINAALKQKEGFGGVGNVYFTNFVVQ